MRAERRSSPLHLTGDHVARIAQHVCTQFRNARQIHSLAIE
jgi:hypothetical protein